MFVKRICVPLITVSRLRFSNLASPDEFESMKKMSSTNCLQYISKLAQLNILIKYSAKKPINKNKVCDIH